LAPDQDRSVLFAGREDIYEPWAIAAIDAWYADEARDLFALARDEPARSHGPLNLGPDSDLYAFHNTLAVAGHGPGALIARTAALKSAASEWLAMLSSRAVAAFCPMPSLNVPSAVCRPTLHMFSDASQEGDSVGLGGYLHCFYWHATVTGVQRRCIAVLEFLVLIISWNTFLPHVGHADVLIHVDNANVVAVVNGTARSASTRKCHTALLASTGWKRRGDARTGVVYIRSAGNQQADAPKPRGHRGRRRALPRRARHAAARAGGRRS
jgi:hypothetical protein